MRNTRVILAVVMVVLLLGGVFAMLPKAAAQSGTTLTLRQGMQVVYTDGSIKNLEEYSPFSPADLTSSGKTVAYVDFRTIVLTDPSKPMVVTSSSAGFKITVMTPSGPASISTAGADKSPKKLFGIIDEQWQIFYLRVPASSFDSAIGSRSSDFTSEIRFSVTGNVLITAKINNISDQYIAFPVTAVFPMTAKSTGGIDPGPCTVNCSEDDPSGKISYKISVQRTQDGQWMQYIGLTQLQTFNLFVTGCTNVDCPGFKAIKYEKWVMLDNDVFNMPNKILYDNPGAQGNYGIYVNGQAVPVTVVDTLQRKGSDNYIVLEMTAQEADIIPKLTDITPTGTSGDHQYIGTIDFIHAHATMTLVAPTQSYPISIPEQTVTVNIGGLSNPNLPPPCDIAAGVTVCPPPVETNCTDSVDNDNDGLIDAADPDCTSNPFDFLGNLTTTQLAILGIGVVVVIAGVALAAKKGKDKN